MAVCINYSFSSTEVNCVGVSRTVIEHLPFMFYSESVITLERTKEKTTISPVGPYQPDILNTLQTIFLIINTVHTVVP